LSQRSQPLGCGIGAEHDIGIEHREQALEIAVTGGCQERFDDLALPAEIGLRDLRRALHAAAGAAGELPCRGWRASHDRRDLLERHREHIVEHKGKPFGRRQRFQNHQQRSADGIGHFGVALVGIAGSGLRHLRAHRLLAPDLRERSMSRQTRATTVVSQPPRFSTADVSERFSRNQVSWTASSTSLVEPSIR
jgi:hypothetical protein